MQPKPRHTSHQPKPTVVLSIFALIGLVMLGIGIKEFISGRSTNGLSLLIFGGLWSVIPLIIMSLMRSQDEKMEIAQELRRTDPAPWLRRADWAKAEIAGTENKLGPAMFLGAIVGLVFCPFFLKRSSRSNSSFDVLHIFFSGLFLIVPVVMIVLGIRSVLRKKTFGQSIFKMSSTPDMIGGKLEGEIEIGGKVRPVAGFQLHLRCLNIIMTGKKRNTKTRVLWEEKSRAHDTESDPSRPILPVSFQIPAECEECDDSNPANRIVWVLEARAGVPGVDYFARFEVPVFKTRSTMPPQTT